MLRPRLLGTWSLSLLVTACVATDTTDDAPQRVDGLFLSEYVALPNPVDTQPLLGGDALEVVAALPHPPANVAVAPDGRVFFTFFPLPQGNQGPMKLAELVDGEPVPFPSALFQLALRSAHAIRVASGRLWVLDHGGQGLVAPRLFAIDLATRAVVLDYVFPRSVGPVGSMFNDLRVTADGRRVVITDSGILNGRGALVTLDLSGPSPESARRLERTLGTANGAYHVHYHGERVRMLGLRAKFGADPIAVDASGTYVYFGALNDGEIQRVRVVDLFDRALSSATLEGRVTHHADTTLTDGITIDDDGRLYLSDMERSRIVRVHEGGALDVLVADPRLHWPDGFSYGPDGMLYVTASALDVFLPKVIVTRALIEANAPYLILRIDPSRACDAGDRCTGPAGQ